MFYKQKFDTFIRSYDDIGYIVNKGNFNDQVTDYVGSIFLRSISREPKELNEIVQEISSFFNVSDTNIIKKDAIEFYRELEDNGFIISGETISDLNNKDNSFSYASLYNHSELKDIKLLTEKSTQSFLDDYLKENPKLISFQIEITSKCNERCVHCYIPHKNKDTDIEPEMFYRTKRWE